MFIPPTRASRLTTIRLQRAFYFASIEAVCLKTLQEVNRDPSAKSAPKHFRKNYMSHEALRQESVLSICHPSGVPLARFRNGRWRRPLRDRGRRLYVFFD